MMRFLREFRGYIARPGEIAAARKEPLKFSYFFRLHLFIAFIMAFIFTPDITDMVRALSSRLQQLPQGIVAQKQGDSLKITGVQQPYTFVDGEFIVTVDTTGTVTERPASSTVFISKDAFEVADSTTRPADRVLWKDGGDFILKFDEVQNLLSDREALAVIVLTIVLFLYFFVSSIIFSILLVITWSIVASVAYRFVFREALPFRDALAVHMVAITAPLVLWGLSVMSGYTAGPIVEIIALVVYSILGLRFANIFRAPGAGTDSSDKPKQ